MSNSTQEDAINQAWEMICEIPAYATRREDLDAVMNAGKKITPNNRSKQPKWLVLGTESLYVDYLDDDGRKKFAQRADKSLIAQFSILNNVVTGENNYDHRTTNVGRHASPAKSGYESVGIANNNPNEIKNPNGDKNLNGAGTENWREEKWQVPKDKWGDLVRSTNTDTENQLTPDYETFRAIYLSTVNQINEQFPQSKVTVRWMGQIKGCIVAFTTQDTGNEDLKESFFIKMKGSVWKEVLWPDDKVKMDVQMAVDPTKTAVVIMANNALYTLTKDEMADITPSGETVKNFTFLMDGTIVVKTETRLLGKLLQDWEPLNVAESDRLFSMNHWTEEKGQLLAYDQPDEYTANPQITDAPQQLVAYGAQDVYLTVNPQITAVPHQLGAYGAQDVYLTGNPQITDAPQQLVAYGAQDVYLTGNPQITWTAPQLAAYGAQDVYLSGNPQITFFKVVYRRHTNFSKNINN